MSHPAADAATMSARACQQRLADWLLQQAYPLWSRQGVDRGNGGFYERLDQHGTALNEPRRARVQSRQIYSLCAGSGPGMARRCA
jgi:mannose/cellobiose epimerase-like protein (N-acyl-D-glucosamine 2-epimerase family)